MNKHVNRREETSFQHKAVHAMAFHGYTRSQMVAALGLSLRSVRRYLNTPCPEWEAEREAMQQRREEELARRPERARILFVMPDHDDLTARQLRTKRLRETISERLVDGVKKADIARQLGMTRQRLNYHIQGGQLQ